MLLSLLLPLPLCCTMDPGLLVFRVPLEYLFFFSFSFPFLSVEEHTFFSSSSYSMIIFLCNFFFLHRIFCAVQDCLSPGKGRALKKIDVVFLWRNYYLWFWN